jgi:hypothetical protein
MAASNAPRVQPVPHAASPANGAAMAAFLAAGIGSFAMGLFVLLHEAKMFSAPALYPPSGGLSGRATFAVIVWLVGWAVMHQRWRDRQLDSGRILAMTLGLIGLGLLATFPPVWKVF